MTFRWMILTRDLFNWIHFIIENSLVPCFQMLHEAFHFFFKIISKLAKIFLNKIQEVV